MIDLKSLALVIAISCSFLWQQASAQSQDVMKEAMPLSNSPSASDLLYQHSPLTYRQQQARFVAEQTMLRMEWNKWHGYVPARPNTNSSYLTSGLYNFQPAYRYQSVYSSRNRLYGW